MTAVPAPAVPLRGPEAIKHALQRLDLGKLEAEQREELKSGKVTRRKPAVQILNIIDGLRRNEVQPHELMLHRAPAIPAVFRPYSAAGNTLVLGDANELYSDLALVIDAYRESANAFGPENAGEQYLAMSKAVGAVMGYGEPVRPKTRERGVSGLMKTIVGTSPKFSFLQRKLISKPVGSVSRGTITVDPELGLDEIAIPENMAWVKYKDYVQGRLVRSGMSPPDALKNVLERSEMARNHLLQEIKVRPVIYSRAPAWHRFNTVAAWPRLTQSDNIAINPYTTTGMNADFDGDTINVHVPSLDDSVEEAKNKLMPSKMIFSIKDRSKVVPTPKHEMVLGLYSASVRDTGKVVPFNSMEEAQAAIGRGEVSMSDTIELPD